MQHQMKLYPDPFERIKSGKKIIEVRLFDEKRQLLNLGDIITFSRLPQLKDKISVNVTGLLRYQSFQDLLNDFPITQFGFPNDYSKKSFVESFYKVYTREEEKKYGVLGIKIRMNHFPVKLTQY